MQFNTNKAIEILEKTPLALEQLLSGLSQEWIYSNEGAETWSPFDVMGHLVHGEKTDWIPRLEVILAENGTKTFTPFDRFAMLEESKGKEMDQLINEFKTLREKNLEILKSKQLTTEDHAKTATHPVLGEVTLSQLLSCWVAHDLGHLAQISRVMAKQYKEEVGPWIEFLGILK